jgi:tetratricopeptide (TPR) repeat protein
LIACAATVAGAPLAAGGVHRATLMGLMALGLVSLLLVVVGLGMQRRELRMGLVVLAPLAFVLVPLLQSVPLPIAARQSLDPKGTALLQEDSISSDRAWPLSLDPSSTREDVGRAGLALVAFIIAYHVGSGQRRHVLVRVVAAAGVTAVFIGLGHRILGLTKIYGVLTPSRRSLLVGPFVNANQSAEFLELAGFLCLACSFQLRTALNRVGWVVGAILCFGGATATLSRGSVLALAAGGAMFLALRVFLRTPDGEVRRWRSIGVGLLNIGLLGAGALALGAGQLVDRFKVDEVGSDVRLRLWRDSLRVLQAHPLGIGRGAFDRVFPIYRTLKMPFPLRFAFVECEPLQLLIDCGWGFGLALLAAIALTTVTILKFGRRDRIEAALVAGAFAVGVHNVVDFGLETLGVLLPFAMVIGIILGRAHAPTSRSATKAGIQWTVTAVAALTVLFGIVSTASASADDFDRLLKKPMAALARRELLNRAQRVHPLDYFYPLEKARIDPLLGAPGAPSPRLHDLNRALRLCPGCEAVHIEVARNLWRVGHRQQALMEWRNALELRPDLLPSVISELFSAGAKAQELAAAVSVHPSGLPELAWFLSGRGRRDDAFTVLNQAEALVGPRFDILLTRAKLQMDPGHPQIADAAKTIAALRATNVQDPRLSVLEAQLETAQHGADGAETALAILDRAADRYPGDIPVQRARLDLVAEYKRWRALDRSLEGFRQALYRNYGIATDAHVWSARFQAGLGHWRKAIDEFRMALGERPQDVALWMEFGHAAQAAGRYTAAHDAFAQAARLSPNSPDIRAAQRTLETHEEELRALLRDQSSGSVPP